ncbi:aspartate-semialdehyde dehydrogenase [Desulfurispira natronophila]|uniref:Aspartate-semialdehyde dehydrogenase n=1 Tax=Desulfurispira natronophila TaxID=682562 RepID=A0A7W8DG06_9BACT|nr:aspartate-semialdehyde dehydrogenase [Desulfurispira natronophila]MBB5020927.1 aspartate-semialdehyde dehydrogenase [Desulfurispira natronophila]
MSHQLEKKSSYNVAIAGVTGAVGEIFLEILAERKFPINQLKLLASPRSAGKKISYDGKEYTVEALSKDSFNDVDIALFSAGGSTSKEFAPIAAKAGAVVIDNSSAFRMDDDVPLVVPEVNPAAAFRHKGIIANPNCTTIIMVVALKPLHEISPIKKVWVSSYQSASGAGAKGMYELQTQTRQLVNDEPLTIEAFSHQLLHNVIPHIDTPQDNGYTREEMKMFYETCKIMGDPSIKVSSTCVRVPVISAHSEAITIESENPITVEQAREALDKAPGIRVVDDLPNNIYPMPLDVAGKDDCEVGRIRKDLASENGLTFWVVGDQLRKGAALNAVQIAELLISK